MSAEHSPFVEDLDKGTDVPARGLCLVLLSTQWSGGVGGGGGGVSGREGSFLRETIGPGPSISSNRALQARGLGGGGGLMELMACCKGGGLYGGGFF